MDGLLATLEMYRLAFSKGGRLALRNWPVLASVFIYAFILMAALPITMFLGFLGGLMMAVVSAACSSSFLYLVEMMVRTSRVTLADFQRSFGAYLMDVLTVNFVIWIGWRIIDLGLTGIAQKEIILAFLGILLLVFLNAVPELIYLGHHSAVALLAESYRFISDNWIEWFPPNLLMLAAFFGILSIPADHPLLAVVRTGVAALFVYFAMVVRGFLFAELSATSRRGRIFRHRSTR